MPIDPIELTFTYCYDDFYPSKKKRSAEFPWISILGWLLVIGFAFGVFLLFGHKPDPRAPDEPKPPSGINWGQIIMWVVILGTVGYSILSQRFGRRKRFDAVPQHPIHLIVSTAGVVIELPSSRIENQWSTYKSFMEDATRFTLQGRTSGTLMVPKRVIPPEQVAAFRQMLEACTVAPKGFPVQIVAANTQK